MESGHFCDKNIFPSHIFHKFNAIDQMILELKKLLNDSPKQEEENPLIYRVDVQELNWIEFFKYWSIENTCR